MKISEKQLSCGIFSFILYKYIILPSMLTVVSLLLFYIITNGSYMEENLFKSIGPFFFIVILILTFLFFLILMFSLIKLQLASYDKDVIRISQKQFLIREIEKKIILKKTVPPSLVLLKINTKWYLILSSKSFVQYINVTG